MSVEKFLQPSSIEGLCQWNTCSANMCCLENIVNPRPMHAVKKAGAFPLVLVEQQNPAGAGKFSVGRARRKLIRVEEDGIGRRWSRVGKSDPGDGG